ncbi:MAG: hypothetical protein HOF23_00340 [Rhodospirillaceae bacterium]|nr:hypothetical protein [Rhodospirillaceae bacterium]
MADVIRAEWFDIDDAKRDDFINWYHGTYLPELQAQIGVNWVGNYAIVAPKGKGNPRKMETDDPAVPPGRDFVVLTAAPTVSVYFQKNNVIEALEAKFAAELGQRENYREAIFVEEESVPGPECRALPSGTGAPPAMQLGNYNTVTPEDDLELARWYRQERFPRLSVTQGMIQGRKLLSVAGWPKHGVLWEFISMEEEEDSFEPRFAAADRAENWQGRHVLEYVVHGPYGPHAGRRIWPE